MTTEAYRLCRTISTEKFCETNDCSVIALSIGCGISYEKAHKIMGECGRARRAGVTGQQVLQGVLKTGQNYSLIREPHKRHCRKSAYTLKTIGKAFPRGRYLAIVKGHIVAIVDGIVHDWAADSSRRVTHLISLGDY